MRSVSQRLQKQVDQAGRVKDGLAEALLALAQGKATIESHEVKQWSSITFSGQRHEVNLKFKGKEATDAGEVFIEDLPEHEFAIPGQLVVDAVVRDLEWLFGANERLRATAIVLLLEDAA